MRLGSKPLAVLLSTTALSTTVRGSNTATVGAAFAFHPSRFQSSNSAPSSFLRSAALLSSTTSSLVASTSLRRSHRLAFHRRGSTTTTRTNLRMSSSSTTGTQTTPGRVALCQFPVTESKKTNHETAVSYLTRAAEAGAQLVVLPEIWNGPYATSAFEEYAEILPDVGATLPEDGGDGDSAPLSPSAKLLMTQAKKHGMWIVGGSVSERTTSDDDDNKIYNTCLVVSPHGSIVAKHRKVHLFDIDVPGGITFKESDTLSAGSGMTTFDAGEPFGMVGVGICYDIRFPEYALLLTQKHNCKILIYPGAFNLTTGPAHWELLQRARAVDNQCYVLTASPSRTSDPGSEEKPKGKYPHYTAWGHSTAISPWGEVVGTCDERENMVVVDLDMKKVEEMRTGIPTGMQKRFDLYEVVDRSKDG